jgi:primosomal protein N' (replication factor Y) (superfamily II helicase)
MGLYAEICLKRRMPKNLSTLSYKIPSELEKKIHEGSYVKIPLRNKFDEGVVIRKFKNEPLYKTKDIGELIYENPILQSWQIALAKWISNYYKCPVQKTIQLFLPPKFYKQKERTIIKSDDVLKEKYTLTKAQSNAFTQIIESKKNICLLNGITGSGKTEIYLHLVEKYIKEGKQSILIVPEISLTPQMIQYFERIFGKNVAILHSRLTEKQRSLEWLKIYLEETPIIIGPRSAIFAPVKNLGLLILDEEHEFSYKQEQSPRYNTIDVIKKMVELTDIKIILGSATPSVSSYYEALNGNYELIEIDERIGDAKLPPVTLVDLRDEFEKKNYSILSELLQEKLVSTLKDGKQAILFLNKRGSASAVVCRECGYIEKCTSCDLPMTYHKILPDSGISKPSLICHHCGKISPPPLKCPNCKGLNIKFIGAGTQKVEEEVKKLFPNANVARVDRDTISKRGSFENIYEKLKNREIDILIGTQMIGKGLHLPNVNLVGVILADIGLHFPDFRSSERTFQLLTQVAGRAGRAETPGEVIIQTYLPENKAIQLAKSHNYKAFYELDIEQRKTFNYPPFSKLIKLTFVDPSAKNALVEAQKIFKLLKEKNPGAYQITLYPALIYKLNNKFRWNILIQGENPIELLESLQLPENCRVDVDPISIG